ncbi:MAG: hypothetical protein WCJ35_13550 [Planctomycetota bacterium]
MTSTRHHSSILRTAMDRGRSLEQRLYHGPGADEKHTNFVGPVGGLPGCWEVLEKRCGPKVLLSRLSEISLLLQINRYAERV